MNANKDHAALVGRVLLASMFLLSGFGKIGSFQDTAVYMVGAGFPSYEPLLRTLLVLTILIEISGATAIIVGWKTRPAAIAVFLFTAAATLVFHRFWSAAPGEAMVQQLMFMKNVSVMGGLLVLLAFGPGRYAFDDAEDWSADAASWGKHATHSAVGQL
jgi:putative oxidoreductase